MNGKYKASTELGKTEASAEEASEMYNILKQLNLEEIKECTKN